MTVARKIAQYKHDPQLLIPGQPVDVFRTPNRKDHHGWHGPAELISVKRRAGSAICDVQGMPLVVPLRNIRRRVLDTLWLYFAGGDTYFIQKFPRQS